MSAVTVRASVLSRLSALVLLVSMVSPLAAGGSTTPGLLDAKTLVAEGAGNEPGLLDALVEPLASPVVETPIAAAFPDTPRSVTKARTPTHEVLRL